MLIINATTDREVWDSLFARLPPDRQDVHFTSAYARVQRVDRAVPFLAVTTRLNGDFVMQPFEVLAIDDRRFDVKSMYGFGGPISNVDDEALGVRHQRDIAAWAAANRAISEYCCLHPLFAELQCKLLRSVNVQWVKRVVVMDLTQPLDLKRVSRRVRRAVNKAQHAGHAVQQWRSSMFPAGRFWPLYEASMHRKNADERWRFSMQYFQAHDSEAVGARWFFNEGRALLTIGVGENAYAHFLGSTGEDRDSGLDEQLYWEAALCLQRDGFKRFHLGGGLSSSVNDSLLQFKQGFSDLTYSVGRYERIFDRVVYNQLALSHRMREVAEHGRESASAWFPEYRREFA